MANQSSQLAEHAAAYLAAGLSVLPARRSGGEKRVALRSWKPYQGRLPMLDEVQAWFSNAHQAVPSAATWRCSTSTLARRHSSRGAG